MEPRDINRTISVIFDLPPVLAAILCSLWLDARSLSQLDVACSSHSQRPGLLKMFSYDGFRVQFNFISLRGNAFSWRAMSWLASRGLTTDTMRVDGSFISLVHVEDASSLPLNPCTCRRVIRLEFEKCPVASVLQIASYASILQSLKMSDVFKSKKTAIIPEGGKSCPQLRTLNIDCSGQLHSDVIASLSLRKLHTLIISDCTDVTKGFARQLNASVDPNVMQYLQLHNIKGLSDKRLGDILKCCGQLTYLDISDCASVSTGSALQHISQHCSAKLQSLNLTEKPKYGRSPMPPLDTDDAAFVQVSLACTNLTQLRLAHIHTLSDQALKAAVQNITSLITLRIESCNSIEGLGVVVAPYAFHSTLQTVKFRSCLNLQGVMNLCEVCSELTTLSFNFCSSLSYTACTSIFKHGRTLTSLTVTRVPGFYGHDLEGLPDGNLPNLTYLNLDGCWGLTADGVRYIARICPNLLSWQLHMCEVDNDALVEVARRCEKLQYIGLEECQSIGQSGLLSLLQVSSSLRALRYQVKRENDDIASLLLSMAALRPPLPLQALYIGWFPPSGDNVQALTALLDACPALTKVQLVCDHEADYGCVYFDHLRCYAGLLQRVYPKKEITGTELQEFDSFYVPTVVNGMV